MSRKLIKKESKVREMISISDGILSDKQAFDLYVSGKSMEPEIADGDIVIVNPGITELKKGELGVFRIHNETTIKRCVPIKNGYILQPTNPQYEPILIHDDTECILIGKVIYKIVKC